MVGDWYIWSRTMERRSAAFAATASDVPKSRLHIRDWKLSRLESAFVRFAKRTSRHCTWAGAEVLRKFDNQVLNAFYDCTHTHTHRVQHTPLRERERERAQRDTSLFFLKLALQLSRSLQSCCFLLPQKKGLSVFWGKEDGENRSTHTQRGLLREKDQHLRLGLQASRPCRSAA